MIFRKRTADDIIAPITKIVTQLENHQDLSLQKAGWHHARANYLLTKAADHKAEASKAASHAETFRKLFPTV